MKASKRVQNSWSNYQFQNVVKSLQRIGIPILENWSTPWNLFSVAGVEGIWFNLNNLHTTDLHESLSTIIWYIVKILLEYATPKIRMLRNLSCLEARVQNISIHKRLWMQFKGFQPTETPFQKIKMATTQQP